MKKILNILANACTTWWASDPFSAGAAVAYYAIFSLPAFLVLIITTASYFLNPATIQGTVFRHVQQLLGKDTASFISTILVSLSRHEATPLSTIVTSVALLIGAFGVFLQLQLSLDKIWNVEHSETGIKAVIKKRLLAFLVIIFLGCLVVASSILGALWFIFGSYIIKILPEFSLLLTITNIAQLFVIITGAFAIMYSFIPNIHVSHRAALVGGIVASLLFAIGKELITFYITFSVSKTAYGAASAIIVILVWIYYSSQIFFFGAALTYVIDRELKKQ